ncbi:uncharacterized protein [Nicotiana tomentosiformis]|uniref:uncharacterized protein n=1 Tax=Nicotiana tomentosiformis TaxID=4098 RepID=UPI00051C6781|nr:uncharacterized protein LOC104104192 [Nicotiana tomentosiformis]
MAVGEDQTEAEIGEKGQMQKLHLWSAIIQTIADKGKSSSPIGGRKSWADEVEEELQSLPPKESIWDKFDITKINKAGFKLEYVAPLVQGETSITAIELEDITSEIEYWNISVVCYVLGAHPPYAIIKGYIKRMWSKHGISQIVMLKNGIILVRFETEAAKNEVLQGSIFHLDNKPFIVKAWNSDMEFSKEEIQTVPIWIKLPGFDFKYWSPKGLRKIGSLVGKPLMVDQNTETGVGLNFARLLVEVGLDTKLPDIMIFRNEKGQMIEQRVVYDRRPTLCKFCHQYGHDNADCMKKSGKKGQQVQEKQGNILLMEA